jgi:hypothetical protein
MLELNDKYTRFDQREAASMWLPNGHGVCLEYINDAYQKQLVCIGVPYGTNMWQARDGVDQMDPLKSPGKKKRDGFTRKGMTPLGIPNRKTSCCIAKS